MARPAKAPFSYRKIALAAATTNIAPAATSTPLCASVTIQPLITNTDDIYIGGTPLSNSNGYVMPAPTSYGFYPEITFDDAPVDLTTIYFRPAQDNEGVIVVINPIAG